jgi:hypothetical protein
MLRDVLPLATSLLLPLAACAVAANQQAAQVAADAKSEMVGMTREQVLACAGIPQQKAAEGSTEVWQCAGDSMNVGGSFGSGNATAAASGNSAWRSLRHVARLASK